jgi:hypothetical protein
VVQTKAQKKAAAAQAAAAAAAGQQQQGATGGATDGNAAAGKGKGKDGKGRGRGTGGGKGKAAAGAKAGGKGKGPSGGCFTCGGDHFQKDCTQFKASQAAAAAATAAAAAAPPKQCTHCGLSGHLKESCFANPASPKHKKGYVPKTGKLAKPGGHAAQLAADGNISDQDQADFARFMQAREMIKGNSFAAVATGVAVRHPVATAGDSTVFRDGGASLAFPRS